MLTLQSDLIICTQWICFIVPKYGLSAWSFLLLFHLTEKGGSLLSGVMTAVQWSDRQPDSTAAENLNDEN